MVLESATVAQGMALMSELVDGGLVMEAEMKKLGHGTYVRDGG